MGKRSWGFESLQPHLNTSASCGAPLRRALLHGAELRARACVTRILHSNGRATGVEWMDVDGTRSFDDPHSPFFGLSDHVPLIARFMLAC